MAKLMAPNIRIDWYPEGHFQDIHNPTIAELNSGVNLSCAIVTGYTLDFTDSNTEDTTTIFDTHTSEAIRNHSYEADLEFFLAPRGSNADNEAAYRKAEELFYNPENRVGYLAKRFGFPWNQAYDYERPRQRVDLFKVQADIPKVVSEDGAPILLNVKYIPQGEAASGAMSGRIRYEWEGEPHNSPTLKIHDDGNTYSYGWEGSRRASPSIMYVNGVEHDKNLIPSPRIINSVFSQNNVSIESVDNTLPNKVVAGDATSVPYIGIASQQILVTPGEYIATAFSYVWGEGIGRLQHQIQFRGPDNYSISAPHELIDRSDVNPIGGRSETVWRVPPDAIEARFYVWFYVEGGFTKAPEGSHVFLGEFSAAKHLVEERALEGVSEYFDGDMPTRRGKVLAKNIIPSPRTLESRNYTLTSNTIGGITDRGNMFPELGDKIGNKVLYFGANDPNGSSVYAAHTQSNSPTLQQGKWYAGSIWVHTIDHMRPSPHRFNLQFRNSVNPTWSSRVAEVYPSGMVRLEVSGQVEGHNPVTWWVFWPSELRDHPGEYVFVGATMLSGPSDSKEEALAQVQYYFDGDSVDT